MPDDLVLAGAGALAPVTLPVTISPALLEKIKAAREKVSPGKTCRVELTLDLDGTLTAEFGYRPKPLSWLSVGGWFGMGKGGQKAGGAQVVIDW